MRQLTPTLLAGLLAAAPLAFAQDYTGATPPQPPPPPSSPPSTPPPPTETSSQLQSLPPLQQLVAPIALDPDPLLALMLPASAHVDQIQAVASNPAGADPTTMDPSVVGLSHYPDILNWMSANPAWTQELGNAFVSSPTDVMNAVQALRQQASAAGTLAPSAYEQIITEPDGQIQILPAEANQISVPSYDPALVYWAPPPGYYASSYFGWSEPYPIGPWLTFDFDWHSHALWSGNWYGYYQAHGGWNHPIDFAHVNVGVAIRGGHPWEAPRGYQTHPGPGGADFARPGEGRPGEAYARPGEAQPQYRPALTEQQRAGQARPEYRAPGNAPGAYGHAQPGAARGRTAYPMPTRRQPSHPVQAPAQHAAPPRQEERRPDGR